MSQIEIQQRQKYKYGSNQRHAHHLHTHTHNIHTNKINVIIGGNVDDVIVLFLLFSLTGDKMATIECEKKDESNVHVFGLGHSVYNLQSFPLVTFCLSQILLPPCPLLLQNSSLIYSSSSAAAATLPLKKKKHISLLWSSCLSRDIQQQVATFQHITHSSSFL